jgi:pimeloyl-ACP methyl ester carboxylesterase
MTKVKALLFSTVLLLWKTTHAFVVPNQRQALTKLHLSSSPDGDHLDVVLFGIGDLRVDDHGGLQAALKGGNKILPLVVLDPSNLGKLPVAHTVDTTTMIASALMDLQDNLQEMKLDLHISSTTLQDALQKISALSNNVHIHVCDLDPVDNALGYGPYSLLSSQPNVHAWRCHLRDAPWKFEGLTDSYSEYEQHYKNVDILKPITTQKEPVPEERRVSCDTISTTIPTSQEMLRLIQQAIPSLDAKQIQQEQGTGLYGTHWGGLPIETIGETRVWQAVHDFAQDCKEDDEKWVQHPRYIGRSSQRKPESLEHATMAWMMKGDGSTPTPVTQNMIGGESMTRYLAAPLWLGTISPRRLWHAAQGPSLFYQSALQRTVESREWHKLLATVPSQPDGLEYGYWRWHGFLCRYARKDLRATAQNKQGLLLVHGFGASSSQWKRSVDALVESSELLDQVLAPDLLGFGHCEKPALSYSQYLWCGFVSDFVKEIGVSQQNWDSFVIGGNSIGGYTSMGVAADDSVKGEGFLSSMGAPGTNRCSGLTLFNTAGKVQSQDEIAEMQASNEKLMTVAQLTAMDALSACKPPPRPIARIFGNGLLTYLRPNIQQICSKVYPTNPEAADEQLCRNILRDSLDPGAVNVMISGSKLPIPRTANEILGADTGSARATTGKEGMFTGPVLVAQGMLDPLNDAKGRAEMLGSLRKGITISAINGGHCPHDEMPQESMKALLQWMEQSVMVRTENLASSSRV